MEEAEATLSVEETNKLRATLGLKPLNVASITAHKTAEQNFSRHRDAQNKLREADSIKQRIEKSRNRRRLNEKLAGATLADVDATGTLDDSLAWIERQRAITMQTSQNYEQLDELILQAESASTAPRKTNKAKTASAKTPESLTLGEIDELYGVTVTHDISDIVEEGGGDVILTIKDTDILEDAADELENAQLVDIERARQNVVNRRKKGTKMYSGFDDDEYDSGVSGILKKNILSHYDEEITGPKKKGFTLGVEGDVKMTDIKQKDISDRLKNHITSLDYNKMNTINDYYTKDELLIKKTKKKKAPRNARKVTKDEGDINANNTKTKNTDEDSKMEDTTVNTKYSNSNKHSNIGDGYNGNFVDDDDLQSSLARERLRAVKKQKRLLPSVQDISESLSNIRAESESMYKGGVVLDDIISTNGTVIGKSDQQDDERTSQTLVFENASEFVRGLPDAKSLMSIAQERLARLKAMEEAQARKDRLESVKPGFERKTEVNDDDVVMEMDTDNKQGVDSNSVNNVEIKIKQEEPNSPPEKSNTLIENEPKVAGGMAATLALLRWKGELEQGDPEAASREQALRKRDGWLTEQKNKDKLRDAERERERALEKERNRAKGNSGGGGGGGGGSGYSMEDRRAERERAREMVDKFKDYTPDININYHDNHGKQLNPKEAFKELSHKFHGRFGGKNKMEKIAKKGEEEKRMMHASSTDTPLNLASAFTERQKQLGTAHIVLSVGSRAAVQPTVPADDKKKRLASGLALTEKTLASNKKPKTS